MGSKIVPATARVRPSRVANIDTDRLERRLAYIEANQVELARTMGDAHGRSKSGGLASLASELHTIRRELAARSTEEGVA